MVRKKIHKILDSVCRMNGKISNFDRKSLKYIKRLFFILNLNLVLAKLKLRY